MQGHVAHIGLVSRPTSEPDAPTQDQVVHIKPSCPSCAVLNPSSAQAGLKLEPTGPRGASYGQVGPKVADSCSA